MKKPNFVAMNPVVAEAIKQMMAEQGDKFSLEKINLAELERRTGISNRARISFMYSALNSFGNSGVSKCLVPIVSAGRN